MSNHHYSVRESSWQYGMYKIVIAGGWLGYDDVDLPLFDSIEKALAVAERLANIQHKGISE